MNGDRTRLAVMAWRNLWRYGRRTLTTIAAMTLALLTLVVWTSFTQGFLRDLQTTIVEVEIGDMQVHPPDYRTQPSIFDRIGAPSELVDTLGAMGFDASARLLGGGLAAAGEASAGVSLRGIETNQDARVSVVYDRVVQGSWLDPSDPAGVVIGGRLARTLDVGLGDELVLLGQATDGSIANGLYRVRGILAPFSEATDRGGVFLVRQAFLDFFVLPGGAHQVVVRNTEGQALETSAAQIQAVAPGLDVLTWRELFPTLATMLDSVESTMYILFMIVYLAIAILLINATLMAVFERIKELGLLKAVGLSPTRVVGLILWEGFFQAMLAAAAGLILSVPVLFYVTRVGINLAALGGQVSISGIGLDPVMRGIVNPTIVVGPLSTMFVIVLLSMLYPALKAARIKPVEAMRHQ
ncbi:MAG: ABC transporter permease [Gemmatimonadetes bacterium]|nr:ABC transporter permease [Gemmatimonadota bacterium]MXX73529.1 ABC transporter permease [Gemmatimonadota bacterium]MYC92519.1 ABC transporter permease [Gemmatimonadota bacterium]MYG33913.1 ABC transporter permease [Gemmatimonadota bacterium]MYJ16713.1 ABC transporter permease [Gemmatimonadota bacterium]